MNLTELEAEYRKCVLDTAALFQRKMDLTVELERAAKEHQRMDTITDLTRRLIIAAFPHGKDVIAGIETEAGG